MILARAAPSARKFAVPRTSSSASALAKVPLPGAQRQVSAADDDEWSGAHDVDYVSAFRDDVFMPLTREAAQRGIVQTHASRSGRRSRLQGFATAPTSRSGSFCGRMTTPQGS